MFLSHARQPEVSRFPIHNLSSQWHIYIFKWLFSSRDDCFENLGDHRTGMQKVSVSDRKCRLLKLSPPMIEKDWNLVPRGSFPPSERVRHLMTDTYNRTRRRLWRRTLIERMQKWRPKKYPFVFVLLSLTSFVSTDKIQKKSSFRKRLVGLISTKTKEYFFWPPFMHSVYWAVSKMSWKKHKSHGEWIKRSVTIRGDIPNHWQDMLSKPTLWMPNWLIQILKSFSPHRLRLLDIPFRLEYLAFRDDRHDLGPRHNQNPQTYPAIR